MKIPDGNIAKITPFQKVKIKKNCKSTHNYPLGSLTPPKTQKGSPYHILSFLLLAFLNN